MYLFQLLDSITKEPTSQKVTLLDVYKEFNETVAATVGLDSFRSKGVTKNFAFSVSDVDVPPCCEYLEVSKI